MNQVEYVYWPPSTKKTSKLCGVWRAGFATQKIMLRELNAQHNRSPVDSCWQWRMFRWQNGQAILVLNNYSKSMQKVEWAGLMTKLNQKPNLCNQDQPSHRSHHKRLPLPPRSSWIPEQRRFQVKRQRNRPTSSSSQAPGQFHWWCQRHSPLHIEWPG